MRIGLVGCTKSKLPHAAPAKDLYMPSALFRGRRAYVEDSCDRWFILSARHHVVEPDEVLDPYDVTLVGAPVRLKREWTSVALRELEQGLGSLRNHAFEIHAGRDYWGHGLTDSLLNAGATVSITAAGLTQGEQLRFYKLPDDALGELLDEDEDEDLRRRRAAERFAWREGDIKWIIPPGSRQQRANAKYAPLRDLLSKHRGQVATFTFEQLETQLGTELPASARNHKAWWANTPSNHQAKAWLEPGWRVDDVNLTAERATFRRFR